MRRYIYLLFIVAAIVLAVWLAGPSFDPNTDLKDKRVLVCGASTGIGEEIAYLYARGGAKLVLTARRKNVLEKVQAKCRDLGAAQVEIFPGDLSLMNTSKAAVEYSNSILGGIDHLILNHMVEYYHAWSGDSDLHRATKLVDIDFLSYVYLATHSLSYLEASHGSVVVVSSAAGMYPSPSANIYAGSKHGLHGFFGSLRQDLMIQDSNITITMVPLGLFGSESAISYTKGNLPDYLRNFGDPADAAYAIVRAAALKLRESYYPFHQTRLYQWVYMMCPEFMDWLLVTAFKQARSD